MAAPTASAAAAHSAQPKFRSRKLDYKRPLPILQSEQIPDWEEWNLDAVNRAVPLVATGVEKEEEEEHHLQAVITATQADPQAAVYIPTPDASKRIDYYRTLYHRHFKMPKSLIRFSSLVEECIGVQYCLDERDHRWLVEELKESAVTADLFEDIITELEKMTDEKKKMEPPLWASKEDLDGLVNITDRLKVIPAAALQRIYDYWHQRKTERQAKPLMPALKLDELTKGESDPFICFRRREIRSTRKTRRTDAQSLQRLRQLKQEMDTARHIMDMIVKREKMRKEALLLEHLIFEQRLLVQEMREKLGLPEDVIEAARQAQRKRTAKLRSSPSRSGTTRKRRASFVQEEELARDPLSMAIEAEIQKRCAEYANFVDITEQPLPTLFPHPSTKYIQSDLVVFNDITASYNNPSIPPYMVLSRGVCRVGRGGRLIYDRLNHPTSDQKNKKPSAWNRSIGIWKPSIELDSLDVMDENKMPVDAYQSILYGPLDVSDLLPMTSALALRQPPLPPSLPPPAPSSSVPDSVPHHPPADSLHGSMSSVSTTE